MKNIIDLSDTVYLRDKKVWKDAHLLNREDLKELRREELKDTAEALGVNLRFPFRFRPRREELIDTIIANANRIAKERRKQLA